MKFLQWSCLCSLFFHSLSLFGVDKLVIISPHRKSIQDEFLNRFESYYQSKYKQKVKVDWIDQGGTENEMRYIFAKYEKNPKSCGIDLFWGGGDVNFIELANNTFLEKHTLPTELQKNIPPSVAGISLRDDDGEWYGTALSTFGLFYNRMLLKILKLPEPKEWEDLGKPIYYDQISATDPRRSATAMLMSLIMLESEGWEKGWELLFSFAGNTRAFTHSSSDPVKAVVTGDAAIAPVVDFYATAKVSDLGEDKLGFILPEKGTLFNSDPIAILKGSPNRTVAERFINFVLSPEGQRLFILGKGVPQGPETYTLGRLGVNPLAYENLKAMQKPIVSNLFKKPNQHHIKISFEKLAASKKLLGDLIGAIHMDNHHLLKKAWNSVKDSKDKRALAYFAKAPFEEEELPKLLEKWDDDIFRNKKINEWVHYAQERYKKKFTSRKKT